MKCVVPLDDTLHEPKWSVERWRVQQTPPPASPPPAATAEAKGVVTNRLQNIVISLDKIKRVLQAPNQVCHRGGGGGGQVVPALAGHHGQLWRCRAPGLGAVREARVCRPAPGSCCCMAEAE